jgi:hypothetical protein
MSGVSLKDRLSPRARAMLVDRPRDPARPATCEAIAARLAQHGRPVHDRVIDFEISAVELAWPGHELGIIDYDPDPQTDDPDDPERTMVPIGSTWDRNTTLFMGANGEIAYYAGYVAMRNASIDTCLEQHAMAEVARFAEPWFSASFGPPLGPRLAGALGLSPVAEASDEYEAWWQSDDLELRHTAFIGGGGAPREDRLTARTLEALVGAMAIARAIGPGVGVVVTARPMDAGAGLSNRRTRLPPVEAWGAIPGATRYAFGQGRHSADEAVWVVGEPPALEVQQYALTQRGIRWETLTSRGGIRREILGGAAGSGAR